LRRGKSRTIAGNSLARLITAGLLVTIGALDRPRAALRGR
jgi:hypothetical protein